LEEGELKDSLGHTVNFRNTIIIMTSNVGVREISKDSRLGFSSGSGMMNFSEIESQAMSALRNVFNPEFINRVDEIIVFNTLTRDQIDTVFDIEFAQLASRLAEQDYRLKITPAAKRLLAEKGWDAKFGGRPLRRTIQKEVESPLSDLILKEAWQPGTVFTVDAKKGAIKLNTMASNN
jgi:ATP-dependent Clp protease ATP-binding subunit ClpC